MASLLKILTLPCEGAAKLLSQAMDESLPMTDRIALGGHLILCPSCRRFDAQIKVLRRAHEHARRVDNQAADEPGGLSHTAKERILNAVRSISDQASPGGD